MCRASGASPASYEAESHRLRARAPERASASGATEGLVPAGETRTARGGCISFVLCGYIGIRVNIPAVEAEVREKEKDPSGFVSRGNRSKVYFMLQ